MISVKDAGVKLQGRRILNGACREFKDGMIHCIIGCNGAGKTTLLRAIAGLIPLSDGKIEIDGRDIRSLSLTERALKISYLPQSRQLSHITVVNLVKQGRFPHQDRWGKGDPNGMEVVENALRATNTFEMKDRPLTALSGGERQRVYIAMALAQESSVLLLDEPSAALDEKYQLEFMELLKKIAASGKTVIMTVHDLPQAFEVGDTVTLVDGGTLTACSAVQGDEGLLRLEKVFGCSIAQDDRPDSLYKYRLVK